MHKVDNDIYLRHPNTNRDKLAAQTLYHAEFLDVWVNMYAIMFQPHSTGLDVKTILPL